jgi:hypothetical protein
MKVLLFYIGTPSPVLESELELIKRHEIAGDLVTVLQCSGNLPNCHWNILHDNSKCITCRSRFSQGWDYIQPGENVELKQFQSDKGKEQEFQLDFNSVDEIKKFQYDNENIGFGVVATLGSIFRDHRFDTKKYHNHVSTTLRTAVQVYKALKKEIMESNPDKVYFFNGRIATHLPAKLLCKKLGLEFSSYEVSQKYNSYTLLENATVHEVVSMNLISQMNSKWTKEKEEIGVSLLRQMRLGDSQSKLKTFTQDQLKGKLPNGFDFNKKNVSFFNGTIDEYAGIENAKGKIYKPDETAGICRILETFEMDNDFFFYLRVHPHMKEVTSTTSQLVDIRKLNLRFKNICVIWPDEVVDTYALMDASEKIITFGSTVGIEATFWGRPSILVDYAKFENVNYAYMPDNHDALVKLLYKDLKPKPAESSSKAIYMMSTVDVTVPFEHFREIKINDQWIIETLDGRKIKAGMFAALWHWLHILPARALRVITKPSLIIKKFQT